MMGTIEAYKEDLKYISPNLDLTSDTSIIGVSTGSFSDFPKMKVLFDILKGLDTPYHNGIHSIHRTPEAADAVAKSAPNIFIPDGVVGITSDQINAQLRAIFAAAGGAAHLGGVQGAVAVVPVITHAVEDSTTGTISATLSELNMPPGKPTGFVANEEVAASMIQKLYNLELPSDFTNIQIPQGLYIDMELLEQLGLTVGESPIGIDTHSIENRSIVERLFEEVKSKYYSVIPHKSGEKGNDSYMLSDHEIPIIIPTLKEELTWNTMGKMKNLNREGFYMGLSKEENVRTGNALIYAAKIIGIFNPTVRAKVEAYGEDLTNEVLKRNAHLFEQQFYGEWK